MIAKELVPLQTVLGLGVREIELAGMGRMEKMGVKTGSASKQCSVRGGARANHPRGYDSGPCR